MSKIPNALLEIANFVATYSSSYANKILTIAKNMAHKDHAKMKIELPEGDGEITYKFESTTSDHESAWDHYYSNIGVFIKNHTEEIKISPDSIREGKLEVTKTAKLEPIINAELANSIWGFAGGKDRQEQLSYVIIGGIAILIFLMM